MGVEGKEHVDLEEKFQISVKVEFYTESVEFEGLNPVEFKVKKKKESKKIENVRDTVPNRRSLF